MLKRLVALFDRYAAIHLKASGRGFALTDAEGRQVGQVESVRLVGSRLKVTGWARAGRVTLRGGSSEASGRPVLRRDGPGRDRDPDRDPSRDPDRDLGFDLEMRRPILPPGQALSLTLTGVPDGADGAEDAGPPLPLTFDLRPPRTALRRLGLWPGFAWRLARVAPDALRWQRTRDLRHRARIKRALGLYAPAHAAPLDDRFFVPGPRPAPQSATAAPITVVLPVFDAFDLLPETLERLRAHTDLPWRLVAIEDASPDPRVRPFLRDWAARQGEGRVELIENAANLGFVGSVNAGLARALEIGRHVVLLNSDALVPAGWASRLMAPLLADPRVATVTPMSNDAEIFSVPAICARLALEPGQADAIDAAARRLDPLAASRPAPTGVGFCMAMSIVALRRLPSFDAAFGRGYGEEVDWCQKARATGGRHLGTGALFVEHRGGASFGSEVKQRLVAANNAVIARRYPGYDGEVQAFILEDPLATARLALGLAWAGAWSDARSEEAAAEGAREAEVPVYLAHAMGGGAEMYLDRRIREDLARLGRPSVVLRVGGPARWRIDLVAPAGTTAGQTDDEALVHRLLEPLTRRHVVYSCGVGDSDPAGLPPVLLRLREGAREGRVEVLFHDYFPVSPSYALLDSRGAFRGPVVAGAVDDPAHSSRGPGGASLDLRGWQAAWRPLLRAADEVVAFSESSRALVLAAYPEAEARMVVRPHRLLSEVPRVPAPAGGPRTLGVLGNIGFHKGAALLCALAPLVPSAGPPGRAIARLVLIGNLDPAYALPPHVVVHGDYDLAELPALVARYGVTDWLIPSIWPETFSFTTHEALATGLPVHAFAIGAQGEAVARAPNGHPLRLGPGGPDAADLVAQLVAAGRPAGRRLHEEARA